MSAHVRGIIPHCGLGSNLKIMNITLARSDFSRAISCPGEHSHIERSYYFLQTIFLDDIGANLKTAKELGISTVLVRDTEKALKELEELSGVQVTIMELSVFSISLCPWCPTYGPQPFGI